MSTDTSTTPVNELSADEIVQRLEEIVTEHRGDALPEEAEAEVAALENRLEALARTDAIVNRQNARTQVRGTAIDNQSDGGRTRGRLPAGTTAGEPTPQMRAFGMYLRSGDATAIRNAQSEGVPSEGGYLVPPEFRDKIVECMQSFGGIGGTNGEGEALAEVITTSTGAPLSWPTVSDSPGGVPNVGVITPEGTQQSSGGADLVFGEASLGAYTYTTTGAGNEPLRISIELLRDNKYDLEDKVRRFFGRRLHRAQAVDFAVGSGVGEPRGILTTTNDVELTTANNLANAANGYAFLLSMEDALDSAYLDNARWVMNRTTWSQARSIVDGDGRPLVLPQATSGIGGRIERSLLGYPVEIDESFPDPAQNVNFMVFGDIRESYVIRRVEDVEVLVDPYSRGKFRQVEYTAWSRADGTIQDRCAYVVAKGID